MLKREITPRNLVSTSAFHIFEGNYTRLKLTVMLVMWILPFFLTAQIAGLVNVWDSSDEKKDFVWTSVVEIFLFRFSEKKLGLVSLRLFWLEKLCVDKIQTTINHSTPTEGEWRGSEKAIDSSNMAEPNLLWWDENWRGKEIVCIIQIWHGHKWTKELTRPGVNCAEVWNPKQQQYSLVLVDTWWYWVSMEWYWLIYDGTGSVEGGCSWYLVVLGQ